MEFDLWDEMRTMERRLDDLFRAFLGTRARTSFPALPSAWRRPFVPATDVFLRKDDIVIRLEVPGIDPAKDIKISVQDEELVVTGERKLEAKVEEEGFLRMESSYGAFERHFPLPGPIDEKKVRAEYKGGILEIVVPAAAKALEAPKARAIPIKTAA